MQKFNFVFGDKGYFLCLNFGLAEVLFGIWNRVVSSFFVLFFHPTVDGPLDSFPREVISRDKGVRNTTAAPPVFLKAGFSFFHQKVPGPSIIRLPRVSPHQWHLRVLADGSD